MVSATTCSTHATMSIGLGITPTSARFMAGDGYGRPVYAVSDAQTPGPGGRIQAAEQAAERLAAEQAAQLAHEARVAPTAPVKLTVGH